MKMQQQQRRQPTNSTLVKGRGEPCMVSIGHSTCCLCLVFFFNRNIATVLVQRGVLKKGTVLLAGQSVARVSFFIKNMSRHQSDLLHI